MALAYPGEDSPLRQKIARDYFLAAFDDTPFETRIREREPPDRRTAYNTALRLEIQHEAAHDMELDNAKNPSAEHRDTRPGRTLKSSRQLIRRTAGDFADQQLEVLQKRVAQMEKPIACVEAEAQKRLMCRRRKPNNFAASCLSCANKQPLLHMRRRSHDRITRR